MLDVLISGGRVLHGAGNPWFDADVGLKDGRVAVVGRLRGVAAARTVDAGGLFVCSGFTDMHTDLQLLASPDHSAKVCQGVTLDVRCRRTPTASRSRAGRHARARQRRNARRSTARAGSG